MTPSNGAQAPSTKAHVLGSASETKISTKDNRSEHLSIVRGSSYNPTGGGGAGRGRRRGWLPEPQAQASEEMAVSWNVPVSSPPPTWDSVRTMCELRTGPRAWDTNSTQLTWTTPYTAGTG